MKGGFGRLSFLWSGGLQPAFEIREFRSLSSS
jgi:hypothetical protein